MKEENSESIKDVSGAHVSPPSLSGTRRARRWPWVGWIVDTRLLRIILHASRLRSL